MSQAASPFGMTPEDIMKPVADMQQMMTDMAKAMPASRMMSPLMTHPTAAAVAASAIGMGAASQMMGIFFGSVQGAMEASRRFGLPVAPMTFDAKTALKSADVEAMTDAGAKIVDDAVKQTEKASKAVEKMVAESVKTATKTAEAATKVARKAEKSVKDAAASSTAVVEKAVKSASAASVRSAEPVAAKSMQKAANATVEAVAKVQTDAVKAAEAMMVAPASIAKPASPDDLKTISGIGPKVEEVLNKLGVWSFAQIAAWSDKEVAWVEDHLQLKGRIGRDDWIGQAAGFAKK
jgi:NADH-quinone oxidoreductase subunit E